MLLWLILPGGVLAGTAWGSYELYCFRTQQNTRKLFQRARTAAEAEDWDGALLAYRQYLQREPEDVEGLEGYTGVLLEKLKTTPEDVGETVRALRRWVALAPNNADAVEKLTGLYLGLREYNLAEQIAASWRTLVPGSADATLAIALAQQGLHKSREAADTLIAAITENPDEPPLYPLLVNILTRTLHEPDEAARWLDQALRVGPDASAVQLSAFAFYKSQDRLDEADKHLRRALELAPDSLDTLLPAGMRYLSQGRLDEAKTLLDHAAHTAPKNPKVLAAQALWATQAGNTAALKVTADAFFNLAGSGNPVFLAQAAQLYLRAGELDRADECLAKLDLLPNPSERLRTHLDTLKGARAFQGGAFYAAINHLRSALLREPSNEWATQLLAAAYAEIADLDGAMNAYRRLMLRAPQEVSVRLRVAELAWRQGRWAEVRSAVDGLLKPSDAQLQEAQLIRLACNFQEANQERTQSEDRAGWLREVEHFASVVEQEAIPLRWLMRCFVLAGRPAQAVDLIRTHLRHAKSGPGLGAELGHLLLSKSLTEQALILAGNLVEQFPDAAEGHVLRANALAAAGRLSEAGAAYSDRGDLPVAAWGRVLETIADEEVIAGQPDAGLALYRRVADLMDGNVSVRRKLVRRTPELDEAMQRSEEIRKVEGDAGLVWRFEQAGAMLRLDPSAESVSQARKLVERCLTDRPHWLAARLLLGRACELSGAFQDAADAYQTAMTQEPGLRGKPVAIRLVGLLNQLGRWSQADSLLNTLVTTLPVDPGVLRLRTKQLIRKRDIDSAIATAERLLELQPDDPAWTMTTVDLNLRAGNAARAEAIARAALTRFPDSAPIQWLLARALIAQQRPAEAETQVRNAASEANDAPHYLALARVLALLDQPSEAEGAIAEAQKLAPENAAVWAACADFWALRNQRTRRIACIRKAIELRGKKPGESVPFARLLAVHGTEKQRATASNIVQRCLAINPEDTQALLLEGQLAMVGERPDLAKAENCLTHALSLDPKLTEAYGLLASMHVDAGRLAQARETINKGLAFAPDDPHLLLLSAKIYASRGDDDRAIRVLRHLLKLRPRMPAAMRLLATAYVNTNQVDSAIAFFTAHAPEKTRTPGEMIMLAKLYESKKHLEHAEALFRQAAAMAEDSGSAVRELLYFLARQEDFDEILAIASNHRTQHPGDVESLAVAAELLCSWSHDARRRETGLHWLDAIARDHPEQAADATYRSGICQYKQGNLDAAERKLLETLHRAPVHLQAVNDLAWLYAEDRGQPGKAVALIEHFLSNGGKEDAHLLDTHSVALMRLGRLGDAEQKALECLKITGDTPTRTAANYHLGVTLLKSGRRDDARSHLQQAMELNERLGGLTPAEQKELKRLLARGSSVDEAGTGQQEG